MHALGRHVLLELYDCNQTLLNETSFIEEVMLEATRLSKATIVSSSFHHFNPHGVSGVIVIAESHVTIHTWPEHGYAAIDIFTCGETVDPWIIQSHLEEKLESKNNSVVEMKRGLFKEKKAFKPETD